MTHIEVVSRVKLYLDGKGGHYLRYLRIGTINTVMSFILYCILVKLCAVNYLLANAICFVIGVISGYTMNALFVFKHKLGIDRLIKYSGVYGSSLLLSSILLFLLVHVAKVNSIVAQLFTIATITVLNYLLIKRFVFVKNNVKGNMV